MASSTSTRGLWITIGALSVALAVTLVLLLGRGDAPGAPGAPAATSATSDISGPSDISGRTAPSSPSGNPSPFVDSPQEVAARERLLKISAALDLHFQKH